MPRWTGLRLPSLLFVAWIGSEQVQFYQRHGVLRQLAQGCEFDLSRPSGRAAPVELRQLRLAALRLPPDEPLEAPMVQARLKESSLSKVRVAR